MPASNAARIAELLSQSKRPLFHVGQGVRIAGAIPDFMALVERLQVPFVTARNANDICASDHPLNIGRPGTFAQRGANFAVQTCDLYIAIGTRLSLAQTGYNSKDYARNAVIVQVDIDQAELDKGTLRDPIKVCMDSAQFIHGLAAEFRGNGGWDGWLARCQNWKKTYPVCLSDYASQQGSVNSYHFIDVLSELCDEKDTIVTDMGFAFQSTHQAWKVKKGQRLLTNCGLAPMGWGLPAAVGAAVAGGGRVICITGDGGLMMNIQELATIQHHQLPIKIFVLNNGGYATIKETQELGFDGRIMGATATDLAFPDFEKIAAAHGIPHLRYSQHDMMELALAEVLNWNGPALCEIILDPNQRQAPRAVNRRNPDGTMTPTKLEDAYPYLDPAVIEAELLAATYPYTDAECEGT